MSRDFLRKILIRDDKSALEALEEIKIQGGDIELVKKEIERVTGIKVYDIDSALSALSDRVAERVKRVDDKIGEISKGLTDDPKKQEAVKREVENIVKGELRTEEEDVDSLTKAASGDKEITLEQEIAAKEVAKTARRMVLEIPTEVRLYREEKAGSDDNLSDKEKELLKKGSGDKNYSEKEDELLQKGLLNRQKKLAEKVASAAELENQEQAAMEKFRDESPGKRAMAYDRTVIATGLGRMSSERREAVLAENNEINSQLRRFKKNIPSNEITTRVLALNDAGAYLGRNKRSLRYLGSYQGGSSFLMRFKMTFYNLGAVLMGRRTTEDGYGFLMTMRGQPASDFVQNSMGLLLKNSDGLGQVFAGMVGSGVKSALGNLAGDAALKLAGGALGPAGLAAAKVLGALKKFFGNAGSKLGIGLKSGLGSAFDKGESFFGKAAMGLGALLGSVGLVGTAFASTLTGGAVVGLVAVPMIIEEYSSSSMISSLVTAKKKCASTMEYVDTGKKPPIPCSDMSQYTEDMRTQILEVGYQTRCAVVTAAQYMIFDFPYHVPYKLGGYGEGDMGIDDDWCNGAMDCAGFIRWCYRQGGFAISKQTSTAYWEGGAASTTSFEKVAAGTYFKTNTLKFVPSNCSQIRERVEPGDIVRHGNFAEDGIMHAAIIIGVDGTKLQIAQEGGFGGTGINTCFIDICTGKGTGENPCGTFDRVSLMDTFFEYYSSGNKKIDGFAMRPFSKYILEFTEMDKKKK